MNKVNDIGHAVVLGLLGLILTWITWGVAAIAPVPMWIVFASFVAGLLTITLALLMALDIIRAPKPPLSGRIVCSNYLTRR